MKVKLTLSVDKTLLDNARIKKLNLSKLMEMAILKETQWELTTISFVRER